MVSYLRDDVLRQMFHSRQQCRYVELAGGEVGGNRAGDQLETLVPDCLLRLGIYPYPCADTLAQQPEESAVGVPDVKHARPAGMYRRILLMCHR